MRELSRHLAAHRRRVVLALGVLARGPAARRLAAIGQRAGRVGYVAKGALYVVLGFLTGDAAVRPYDPLGGARGALRFVYGQPLGRVVVGVLGLGLFAYVAWLLVQAALDPLSRGNRWGGVFFRLTCLATGALYAGLAWQALRLAWGVRAGPRDERIAAAWLKAALEDPRGRWIAGAVAAGVLAYAASQLARAVRGRHSRVMDLSGLSRAARRRVLAVVAAGLAARGIVTGLAGWFVLRAAVSLDPREVRTLAGVLRAVRDQPHGPTLLAALSLGLAAYGTLQWLRAAYWAESRLRRP